MITANYEVFTRGVQDHLVQLVSNGTASTVCVCSLRSSADGIAQALNGWSTLEQELGSPTDEPNPNGSTHARLNWWKDRSDSNNETIAALEQERDGLKEQFAEGERRWERMRAELAESDSKISAMRQALEEIQSRITDDSDIRRAAQAYFGTGAIVCLLRIREIINEALTQSPPVEEDKRAVCPVCLGESPSLADPETKTSCDECGNLGYVTHTDGGIEVPDSEINDKRRVDWLEANAQQYAVSAPTRYANIWHLFHDEPGKTLKGPTLRAAIDSALMSEKGER